MISVIRVVPDRASPQTNIGFSISHQMKNKNIESEKERIGIQFTQRDKMISEITYLLNNPKKFMGCREIAQKYYDKDNNIIKMIEIYDELLGKYG